MRVVIVVARDMYKCSRRHIRKQKEKLSSQARKSLKQSRRVFPSVHDVGIARNGKLCVATFA